MAKYAVSNLQKEIEELRNVSAREDLFNFDAYKNEHGDRKPFEWHPKDANEELLLQTSQEYKVGNRISGAAQMVAGMSMLAVAAVEETASGAILTPIVAAQTIAGADLFQAGIRSLISGNYTATEFNEALKDLGLTESQSIIVELLTYSMITDFAGITEALGLTARGSQLEMTLANSARMQKLLAQTKAIKAASKLDDIANNTGKVSTAGKNVIDKASDIAETGIRTPSHHTGYLAKPAEKNGILNIGAGNKPVNGAYNVDLNPSVSGVHSGSTQSLSNIASGSQSKVIFQNPYKYDVLTPEVSRVLQEGGVIEISGNISNGTFKNLLNMSDTELIRYGYSRIPGQSMAPASGMQTSGELISGRVITFQLRKN